MMLRENSYDNDGNIDVDGDHVEGNNEDDQCALTCWMELVTVSRESKEFATRSIFPEIYLPLELSQSFSFLLTLNLCHSRRHYKDPCNNKSNINL